MNWSESDGVWSSGPWTISATKPSEFNSTPRHGEIELRWNERLIYWSFDGDVDRLKGMADLFEQFEEMVRESE